MAENHQHDVWAHPGWQFAFVAVSLVVAGVGLLFAPQEVGSNLIFIGVVGVLFSLWWVAWTHWGSPASQFVSLDEALRIMFEVTDAADRVQESSGVEHRGASGRNTYHYNQLRLLCREGRLAIYGCKAPSQKKVILSENDFYDFRISPDFTSLVRGDFIMYSGLCVQKPKLKRAARYIRSVVKKELG